MKKYIVVGDTITSCSDGDKHYISPWELCKLYNVNPKECYLIGKFDRLEGLPILPVLRPRYYGDYRMALIKLHKQKAESTLFVSYNNRD